MVPTTFIVLCIHLNSGLFRLAGRHQKDVAACCSTRAEVEAAVQQETVSSRLKREQ